jgi:phasin
MRETNSTAAGTRSARAPKIEAPQAIREMADKGTTQAKESYEKMTAATAEASNVIQNACSTAARGAIDCNAKMIEFARANSNAAFDYASKLLGVKSPSEFLEVSTEHARKRFEVLSEQTKELTALSQKVMLETTEPLKSGAAKAFRGPLA